MRGKSPKIKLISKAYTLDAIGQQVESQTKVEKFCDVRSVTASEDANAGTYGLKAEWQFVLWAHEYGGQNEIEYESNNYVIYRTYIRDDGRIELYAGSRVGVTDE